MVFHCLYRNPNGLSVVWFQHCSDVQSAGLQNHSKKTVKNTVGLIPGICRFIYLWPKTITSYVLVRLLKRTDGRSRHITKCGQTHRILVSIVDCENRVCVLSYYAAANERVRDFPLPFLVLCKSRRLVNLHICAANKGSRDAADTNAARVLQ